MEAKIDVRKLQLLNDRISQTMEALNQVRSSVRGLSHSAPGFTGQSFTSQPFTGQPFAGYPQAYGQGYVNPLAFGQQAWGIQPGISHSPYGQVSSYGQISPQAQLYPQLNPMVAALFAQQAQQLQQPTWSPIGLSHSPFATQGTMQPMGLPNIYATGLSHSSPEVIEQQLCEQRANDPLRNVQTFPNLGQCI
ncbi:MAG: hypothetical protein AB7N76_29180 [Planctomycetota bacterium]